MTNEIYNSNTIPKRNKYAILTKFINLVNFSTFIFYVVLAVDRVFHHTSSYQTLNNFLFATCLQFMMNITIMTTTLKITIINVPLVTLLVHSFFVLTIPILFLWHVIELNILYYISEYWYTLFTTSIISESMSFSSIMIIFFGYHISKIANVDEYSVYNSDDFDEEQYINNYVIYIFDMYLWFFIVNILWHTYKRLYE